MDKVQEPSNSEVLFYLKKILFIPCTIKKNVFGPVIDNIRNVFRIFGYMAQDREQWRALVNTVMKLQVL
jgi:phosphomevalonate kinase